MASEKEVTALHEVAYVLCYGHFPNSAGEDTADIYTVNGKRPSSSLGSDSDGQAEANPFSDGEDTKQNPFCKDDSDNPFGDNEENSNPFGENETEISPTEESNPLMDENDGNVKAANNPNTDVVLTSLPSVQNSKEVSLQQLTPEQEIKPSHEWALKQTPKKLKDCDSYSEDSMHTPLLDPLGNSSTLAAKMLTNAKDVSRTHAKEILAEAFNVTQLDLSRLKDEINKTKSMWNCLQYLLILSVIPSCIPPTDLIFTPKYLNSFACESVVPLRLIYRISSPLPNTMTSVFTSFIFIPASSSALSHLCATSCNPSLLVSPWQISSA
ncbi:hypothetical protein SK128_025631 [Halocaridina rubra]|uniref:Uncharacterized protein n=1 Tax=Halocaridina rubra TaxID=373956 RepID=A0AAN9A145_HALRR